MSAESSACPAEGSTTWARRHPPPRRRGAWLRTGAPSTTGLLSIVGSPQHRWGALQAAGVRVGMGTSAVPVLTPRRHRHQPGLLKAAECTLASKETSPLKKEMFKRQRYSKVLSDPHAEESGFYLCLLGNAMALAFRKSAS